jgi:lysozyme family protein
MSELSAEERFARCLTLVLKQEGGYADNPKDPGGTTNLGITRKTLARWRNVSPWWDLPKAEVKALAVPEASRIYASSYWRRVAGEALPAGIDLALFDYAVNSGPERAIKALQASLKVKADGDIGPLTLEALKARIAAAGAASVIAALCDGRLSFLQRLATFAVFGRGWSRRVAEIRTAALAMADVETLPLKQRTNEMNMLSGYKTYIVAGAMLLAGVSGLLGVDLPAFEGHAPASLVMEALAFFFLRKGLKSDLGGA